LDRSGRDVPSDTAHRVALVGEGKAVSVEHEGSARAADAMLRDEMDAGLSY
jgi:hypothetical protein